MTAETLARIEAGEIRGERLLLRPPRMSDSGPLSLYAGDERVAKMTAMIPHPYPPGAAEAFIAAATSGRSPEAIWVIDATPDDGAEMVGVIGVKHGHAELGYWIGPPFWGTGYASEAAPRRRYCCAPGSARSARPGSTRSAGRSRSRPSRTN